MFLQYYFYDPGTHEATNHLIQYSDFAGIAPKYRHSVENQGTSRLFSHHYLHPSRIFPRISRGRSDAQPGHRPKGEINDCMGVSATPSRQPRATAGPKYQRPEAPLAV
jgi:hypothetical protein